MPRKEAILAKQRMGDVHCQIFMMDERAFNKEFNAYYQQSKQQYGVEYTRCRISAVREDPVTHDLIVRYPDEEGRMIEDRFNMVVLSVGSLPPDGAEDLARVLGIELNQYGFAPRTNSHLWRRASRASMCAALSPPRRRLRRRSWTRPGRPAM
jgi:Heterodisulfide reductase, subunit A and related polyferredoxins